MKKASDTTSLPRNSARDPTEWTTDVVRYGEVEFWAALGKMLLIVGLVVFTFITMLGGNPLGDRFGFRYWQNPGAFAELYASGALGRFLGFLQCLIQASFVIAGPDTVSMAAGEAENPRVVMPRAYNAVFYRLAAFFVLGSLAVGILVPHNDPEMKQAFSTGAPGAAASPVSNNLCCLLPFAAVSWVILLPRQRDCSRTPPKGRLAADIVGSMSWP